MPCQERCSLSTLTLTANTCPRFPMIRAIELLIVPKVLIGSRTYTRLVLRLLKRCRFRFKDRARFQSRRSRPLGIAVCILDISRSSAPKRARVRTGSAPARHRRCDNAERKIFANHEAQAWKSPIVRRTVLQRAIRPSRSFRYPMASPFDRRGEKLYPPSREMPAANHRSPA
jgi:hypothetical protein